MRAAELPEDRQHDRSLVGESSQAAADDAMTGHELSRGLSEAPRLVRVVTPDAPPALAPGAACALLGLLRTAADQWVDGREGVVRVELGGTGCDEEQGRAA